jgi:hypothetical protein
VHCRTLTTQAKIILLFYHHNRDTNRFLQSSGSISRTAFIHVLILGYVDVCLTLHIGIINVSLEVLQCVSGADGIFYAGWDFVHTDWEPVAYTYASNFEEGGWSVFFFYWREWADAFLPLIIFGLLGLKSEARATYRRALYALCDRLGWKLPTRNEDDVGEIVFGARQTTTAEIQSR